MFDERIKETLTEATEQIAASDLLKQRIHRVIINQETREEPSMKKIPTIKRIAVIAATLCCLATVTVFAVDKISAYITASPKAPTYTELPTEKDLSQDLGFAPKTVKEFSNGFSFLNARIGNTQSLNDGGKTLEQFKEIRYTYVSQDGRKIDLDICKPTIPAEISNPENAQTTTYHDVVMTYFEQLYKFVPTKYEMTDDEKAAQERGEVIFSCGSNDVRTSKLKFLNWTDEGINYLIMAEDTNMVNSDFVDMAKEIINQ